MRKIALLFLVLLNGFTHSSNNNSFILRVNEKIQTLRLAKFKEFLPDKDKYGLVDSDYDINGWAKVNGKWVSNPRTTAVVKYAKHQVIATSSTKITKAVVQGNPASAKPYRNFSSIEETYPILEKVAQNLEYSDIEAMRRTFSKYKPLEWDEYYLVDGIEFYSNEELLDYRIKKAEAWGNKGDTNGDGVINCMDFSEHFYQYALELGYHCRLMANMELNHAFNQVNINGQWVSIEPQSAKSGLDRSPLVSVRFPKYNPAFDEIWKEM